LIGVLYVKEPIGEAKKQHSVHQFMQCREWKKGNDERI